MGLDRRLSGEELLLRSQRTRFGSYTYIYISFTYIHGIIYVHLIQIYTIY